MRAKEARAKKGQQRTNWEDCRTKFDALCVVQELRKLQSNGRSSHPSQAAAEGGSLINDFGFVICEFVFDVGAQVGLVILGKICFAICCCGDGCWRRGRTLSFVHLFAS